MGGPSKGTRSNSESESTAAVLKDVLAQLKTLTNRITKLEEKVIGIEEGITYNSKSVDELKSEFSIIKESLPVIKEKVEEQDLVLLNKSVDIQGIPHHPSESLIDIVVKIGEMRGTFITSNNIDLVYRNKSKKSVVVRFLQTHVRNSFVQSFQNSSTSPLKTKDIGFTKTDNYIYVNDLLSFHTRKLFFLARTFKKEHDYNFVWTRNQKVYLRKDQEPTALLIKCENDLKVLRKS